MANQIISPFVSLRNELNSINIEKAGRKDLGQLNIVSEIQESFFLVKEINEKAYKLSNRFKLFDPKRLSNGIKSYITTLKALEKLSSEEFTSDRINNLHRINSAAQSVITVWNESLVFWLSDHNEEPQSEQKSKYQKTLTELKNDLAFDEINKSINELEGKANRILYEAEQNLNSFKSYQTKESKSFEGLINDTKKVKKELEEKLTKFDNDYSSIFSDISLLKQSHLLKDRVKESEKQLTKWKIAILVLCIVVVGISYLFLSSTIDDVSLYRNILLTEAKNNMLGSHLALYVIIKNSLIRVFVIAFIVYILKTCVRLHNALIHNIWIINHKIFNLDAVRDLTFNMENSNDKKDIFTQAASELFKSQKTGFLIRDDGKIDLSLLEKIKSVIK